MALELNQFLYVKGLRHRSFAVPPRWVQQLQNVRWYEYPTGDLSDISDFLPVTSMPSMYTNEIIYHGSTDSIGKKVMKKNDKCVFLRSDAKHLDTDGNLHNDGNPAYISGDTELFFLHGVHISKEFAHMVTMSSHDIDPKQVLAIQHVDVRRELIRKIGIEQFIDSLYHKVIDRQGDYELIEVLLTDNTWSRARYLKMLNPSIGAWHVEGVPNECATVEAALLRRNNNWFAHADILT